METLSHTEPHYIRCVKPNNLLKPAVFENANVMQQLRCGGVLEAIRISCAGYPTRRTFSEFISRFKILVPEAVKGSYDERDACIKILKKMGLEGYQIGKTKLFLRAGQMVGLNELRGEILGKASKIIQNYMKSYIGRKKYVNLRKASINLQAIIRGRITQNTYIRMRREASSIKIQKNIRRHLSRKAYNTLQISALDLQTSARAAVARRHLIYKKKTKASTKIQAHWRGHREYNNYYNSKRAVLISQSRWRGRLGRKELKKLKVAAKESGALKEAKDKLEKKVEELTSRLQYEKHRRTELVEEKEEEISQLQKLLKDMEMEVEEVNSLLTLERENAKKLIEEAAATANPNDSENIKSLIAEVDDLKALLQTERERADELQEKCLQAEKPSNEEKNTLIEDREEEATDTTVLVADTEKIESLTTEIDNLKIMLESEGERADEWEKRCLQAQELFNEMENKSTEKEEEEEEEVVKQPQILVIETEKIESVIAEVEKLKALLESERERADELQKKCLRAEESSYKKTSNLSEEDEATVGTMEAPIPVVNTKEIESLTTEINNLKELLQSESERADEWERKFLQAEESCLEKQIRSLEDEVVASIVKEAPITLEETESLVAQVDELKILLKSEREHANVDNKEEQEALVAFKEELVQVIYTDKIKSLATEIDELQTLLKSEREHANEWEKKCLQAEESSSEKQKKPTEEEKEEEAMVVAFKEDLVQVVHTDKFESLAAEIDELQVLLQTEKERADEWQKKFLQAEESCNEKQEQLEEIEEGVQQIEESMNSVAK